ncbi:HoxN/HupN/NixA family nickel/cobalt transporter [Methanotorris igneus]|uniref:High-affinity nickel-transporter n=1 Tax=Methanotorris igneus (strain DSM 5666 / JCM 11834 / Kol 5) TaxID=880724 RepID=F6BCZ9_METIK|nr:sulfite exporter TauE/SafE family protein [Methanotorris igneus]AEF96360.1 high-affinity nickel-transporter [Methanotorris igneus Kol 5]
MELVFTATAFILGMLHALEPGHGKSVLAAYVLGTKANIKDAITLGVTITLSHIFVVFMLGILSIYLIKSVSASIAHDLMGVIGGAILIGVGLWILNGYFHPHEHKIDTKKGIIAIGLSAGLTPCPAALAVLLFSIVEGDVLNGLIYVVVFSIGLALSLTTLSVLFIKSKEFIQKYAGSEKINKLPLISGTIIILIGLYIVVLQITALSIISNFKF